MAAQCLALARQTTDLTDRAFLLEMAQKWFQLAEFGWEATLLRAVQAEIGERLRAQYHLPVDLPEDIFMLLQRLDERHAE